MRPIHLAMVARTRHYKLDQSEFEASHDYLQTPSLKLPGLQPLSRLLKYQLAGSAERIWAAQAAAQMQHVLYEVKRVVVGQDAFLERVLVALLAQGHLLIEGVPGLEVVDVRPGIGLPPA